MRLEQLYQIIEIEKHQSISKAAKALFIGQSTLSGSLTGLEEEIGVRIFERSATGVTPTLEGHGVIQLAHQAVDTCGQILNYGKQSRELYGEVTLLLAHPCGFLVSDIMVAFKERYPKAELNLKMETADKILQNIAQNTANLGLVMVPDEKNEIARFGLQFEKYKQHFAMLFVSQESRFAEQERVSLEELRHEKFVTFSSSYWSYLKGYIQTVLEPLIIPDRETLKQIVSNGHAIAILPDTFAERDLYCAQGLIKTIPIDGAEAFGQDREHLVYPPKRQLTLLEQKTLELLREILQKEMK